MKKDLLGYRHFGDSSTFTRVNAFDATWVATRDATRISGPSFLSSPHVLLPHVNILNNTIVMSLRESIEDADNVLAESDRYEDIENELKPLQFFNLTKGATRDHKRN